MSNQLEFRKPENIQVPMASSTPMPVGAMAGDTTNPPHARPVDPSLRELVTAAVAAIGNAGKCWSIGAALDLDDPWLRVTHSRGIAQTQGWKLHISATSHNVHEVLQRALPVLLAGNASFKLAKSTEQINWLNEGSMGASQIGKFMTIYPNDEAQAVHLAIALDEATQGLSGPVVPTDRPLGPGSLVSYRYGGFAGRHTQTPLGQITSAIRTPEGELVPDERRESYNPPAWAADPFLAAGVAAELPNSSPLLDQRYLIASPLFASPRGAVQLAVDINIPRRCVLKQARHGTFATEDGGDACDRLRHEFRVLRAFSDDPRIPDAYDLTERDGDLYLAMEDMDGVTLEGCVWNELNLGLHLPTGRIIAIGRELASIVGAIHARGLAYRDLKSANVIVTPDGHVRLIDFDISMELGSMQPGYGRGTPGYWSPQQEANERPAITDDVHAFGAVLYFMATGAEPSQAPHPRDLLRRPPALLNPDAHQGFAPIIARCLAPDPADRYQSMAEIDAALATLASNPSPSITPVDHGSLTPESDVQRRYRDFAHRTVDALCTDARHADDDSGCFWVTSHEGGAGALSRDLNIGSAGTVLVLAEAVAALGDPVHRKTLADGARWLAAASRLPGKPLPGLYVGESGKAAALLRAGQALDDPDLIAEAARRGRWIAALPHVCPDLFNGSAGRLRFHLMLWDETRDPIQLGAAIAAGEFILAAATATADGGLSWTIPDGYSGLSGQANLGYAHGAAGIGDALLDLHEATGDERYRDGARGAARWLAGLATPVLADGSGLNWPANVGEPVSAAFWCHGAAGIGRFFLHAALLDLIPEARAMALGAARTVARAARWANPTQCHGLSGNIEFLLDAARDLDHPDLREDAYLLARILEAWAIERGGQIVWPAEHPREITPDYWVGYAGVAACLLRLTDPAHRPHLMSRAAFRRAATPILT